MRNTRLVALSFLVTLTSLHAARAADAPSATEGKNEIVVFGGISLLDASRSGVVLSSIHHREQARMYAKQVRDGRAELELSPEEAEAVRLAMAGEEQSS